MSLPRNGSVSRQEEIPSGGVTTMIFIADGAGAVSSFVMRSETSGNMFMFVPLGNTTLTYNFLRTSTSRRRGFRWEKTCLEQHYRVTEVLDANSEPQCCAN